jgi:hypothetical protein
VLRAAEAAAAAAQAAAAAAQAASLPPAADAAPQAAPPPPPPEPQAAPQPAPAPAPGRVHEAGAPARLLAAAGELEAQVAQARAQLDALADALGRVERSRQPPD